jgi:hypothetical protein
MKASDSRVRVMKEHGHAIQARGRGRFAVSPTRSIPGQENPTGQVTTDNAEASQAMLTIGLEAPE